MVTAADPVPRVVRNSTILLGSRLISLAAGAVTLPVLLGGLGAHTFGVWVLLNGLVGILAYVDLGLGTALIREVARARETACDRRARAVQAMCALWGFGFGGFALGLGASLWPVVAGFVPQAMPDADAHAPAFGLILLSFWVGGIALPWRCVLEGTQRYAVLAGIECGAAVLTAAILTTVAVTGGGLTALAAFSLPVAAVRTVLVVATARRRAPALTPSLRLLRRPDVLDTLRFGLRVQATRLATAVNLEADRIVMGVFFGPVSVAAYEPGRRMANLFRMPAALLAAAAFPAVSQVAVSGGRERLDQLYVLLARWLATFAAVGGAALVVSAEPLIRLWLGRPLPLAAATLATLGAGSIVNLAVQAASVTTCAEGQPGRETRYAFVAAALNILLAIPLLKLAGPWGVPLATAIAAAAAGVYFVASFHRRSGRPARLAIRTLVPPGLAALLATGLTFALTGVLPDGPGRAGAALAVGCRGGLAALAVLTVLAVLRYLTADDLARLRSVAGGRRRAR